MGKVEIIPPNRSNLPAAHADRGAVTITPPRMNPGGPIASTITRWEANWQRRAISAVAERTAAETKLFEAQREAIDAYVRRQQAAYRLQELPEILANERAKRRIERAEDLRAAQHRFEMSELSRQTELARIETVLEDARQALRAQRDFGYSSYELEWQKRQCEILDVELNAEERREILREHRAKQNPSRSQRAQPGLARADQIDDALYEARAQLRASGLDTARIDALLRERAEEQ